MLRIALVLVVVLFGRYVAIALAGMVLVHGANFILSLVARPYINSVEDVLTAVCAFCSMITALLGLGMFAKRDSVPEEMIVAVVLGDLLIPILAFFVSAVVLMTRESQKQKRLKQMELEARSRAAYEMYGAAATGKDGGNMQDMQTVDGGHVSPYGAGPYYGPATVVPVTVIGDEVKPVSHSRSNTAAGDEVPIEQLSPAEKEIRRCRLALVLIDRKINARVIVVLSNFFMFIGFILFIALVFCVLSLLFQTNPDVIPPRPLRDIQSCDFSRRFNFAGYASWQEFTSNCCCTEAPSYDSYQSVEVWHCRNGRYKERVRAETGRGNGFALRGMCSPFFASGVGAPRCVKNAFQVTAGSAASAYALQNLW
jgi:predicted permease